MPALDTLRELLPEYEVSQDKDGIGNPFVVMDEENQLGVKVILKGIPPATFPSVARMVRASFQNKLREDVEILKNTDFQ